MATFNPYLQGLGEMDVASLVDSVYAAEGAVETAELEWKREWDLTGRLKRAGLAKHIIGFANRDPALGQALYEPRFDSPYGNHKRGSDQRTSSPVNQAPIARTWFAG